MRQKIFTFAIIFLFVFQTGLAQRPGETSYSDSPVLPEGIKGERIRAIIDTVNSGDPERVRKFINTECAESFRNIAPMDEHIGVFLGFFRETGGIAFSGIRNYVPERAGETVVIVKDSNFENWRGITVRFGGTPDHLIAGIGISPARSPKEINEPPLTEDEAVGQIKSLMTRLIDRDVFSGALLIANGEKVLLTTAGGEASKAFHVANNIDTKFNLGSMNKMFTAIAVVQLAEKGKLSFSDPISKYIDESWLPREVTDKITIHHLLSHSSGLGSYFNETYQKSSRELFRKLDDYKPLIKDDRPVFTPGTRFQYSIPVCSCWVS